MSWPGEARFGDALPSLAVLGACLAWPRQQLHPQGRAQRRHVHRHDQRADRGHHEHRAGTPLRELGAARTGAYFPTALFAGAILGEPVTAQIVAAGVLTALGVWLHLSERHEHAHEQLKHTHPHYPDSHHRHDH